MFGVPSLAVTGHTSVVAHESQARHLHVSLGTRELTNRCKMKPTNKGESTPVSNPEPKPQYPMLNSDSIDSLRSSSLTNPRKSPKPSNALLPPQT